MALADKLEPARSGPNCSVGIAVAGLDAADLATLTRWLADPTIQHVQIARALQSEGHAVKADAISRHRKGECGCATG